MNKRNDRIADNLWWAMGVDPLDPGNWSLMSEISHQIEQEIYYGDYRNEVY